MPVQKSQLMIPVHGHCQTLSPRPLSPVTTKRTPPTDLMLPCYGVHGKKTRIKPSARSPQQVKRVSTLHFVWAEQQRASTRSTQQVPCVCTCVPHVLGTKHEGASAVDRSATVLCYTSVFQESLQFLTSSREILISLCICRPLHHHKTSPSTSENSQIFSFHPSPLLCTVTVVDSRFRRRE